MASVVRTASSVARTNQTSGTAVFGAAAAAGNGIAVVLRIWDVTQYNGAVTVSCNGESNLTEPGGTYARFWDNNANTQQTYCLFLLPSITTANTKTITVSFGAWAYFAFDAYEINGHNATTMFQRHHTGTATAQNPTISVTPDAIGDVIIGTFDGNVPGAGAGTGYTGLNGADNNLVNFSQYRTAAASGAQNCAFVSSGSAYHQIAAWIINNAAAAAPRLHAVERSRSIARGILRGV